MKLNLVLPLLLVQLITASSYGSASNEYHDKDELLKNVVKGYVAERMKNDFIKDFVSKYMPFEDEEEPDEDIDMNDLHSFSDEDNDAGKVKHESPENINDDLHMKIAGDNSNDHVGHGDIMFRPGEEEAKFEGGSNDVSGYKDATIIYARWPNPVPYYVDRSLGYDAKYAITKAINEFHAKTCIRFVRRARQKDYLFFFKGSGCWSYIGRKGGKQGISLGRYCEYKKTAVHEMMHALGFFHEQSRPDRDQYVTINWENIEDGMSRQFTKQRSDQVTTFGHPYDYRSVMHYPRNGFGKKYTTTSGWWFAKTRKVHRRETITPKINTGLGQCWDCGLSAIDAAQLNAMYCKKT